MGLDPTKGLDIVMDEVNEMIAVQSDNDCKKTRFKNSLFPVQILFSMFNTLTDYEGHDHNGLKKFKLKKFDENAPSFYFLFDENNTFTRSRIHHEGVGSYDFEALLPLEAKQFLEEDWYTKSQCELIEDHIIEDTSNFASFMYQLVINLIGGEEKIYELLGIPKSEMNKYAATALLEDEEFDD